MARRTRMRSALQEIQTFTGGRLAGITGKLVVRTEDVSYFDRKEKKKKTSSIWALSLEADTPKLRAATDFMASALAGAPR